MFKQHKGFTKETISSNAEINGKTFIFECWMPPLGYGLNSVTGEVEKTDVLKRSTNPKEQYWQRTPLPDDWDKRRTAETEQRKKDKDFYDPVLAKFEQQEWRRRLCGLWFYNKGKPCYLTGLHYFILNWWKFDGRYFNFRDPNRKLFYVWDYCCEDTNCLGLIEITKRKEGKTARAGAVEYEYVSRTGNVHGGIQSKTDDDAYEVFMKAIISPWKKLPDFFRPIYDTAQGDTPKNELRFFKPSQRGKKALHLNYEDAEELESWIDYKASGVDAYDGPLLHRYISDEAGKLRDVSIVERHNTVQFCSEVDGRFIGKHLYTTTVEDMESGGSEFHKLIQLSDPDNRDKNGRTQSGLYTYFLPAYQTMYSRETEKYGFPDEAYGREYFMNKRDALRNNPRELASFIRKNPFSLSEAFDTGSDKCHFNSLILREVCSSLMWSQDEICEAGNFEWEGERFGKVVWKPIKTGRWLMPKGFKKNDLGAGFERRGNLCYPSNTVRFISGCDPYQHGIVEVGTGSLAASHVYNRYDTSNLPEFYDKAFICQYHSRPKMSSMFHEDMAKQCMYFGCQILIENNKEGGIRKYFIDNGLEAFLIRLPQYKDYGIPSSEDNKALLVNLMEEHIERHGTKIYFYKLADQLIRFDVTKTEKSDLVMSSGWTLVADYYKKARIVNTSNTEDISNYFRRYKAG